MSIKKISKVQPESFEFSKDNFLEAEKEISKKQKSKRCYSFIVFSSKTK